MDDGSIEETLQRHGMSGAQLMRLSRKAADDALHRHGAFLDQQRFDELADYLLEVGVKYVSRYEDTHGIGLTTFLYRRMRIRYIDWLRTTLGDARHPDSPRRPPGGHVTLGDSDGPTLDELEYEESVREAAVRIAAEHNLSARGTWVLIEIGSRLADGAPPTVAAAEAGLPRSQQKASELVEDLRRELGRHGVGGNQTCG